MSNFKVSTAHIVDAEFRQAAMDELFRIHLEAAHFVQQSCAFADIVVPINHEVQLHGYLIDVLKK